MQVIDRWHHQRGVALELSARWLFASCLAISSRIAACQNETQPDAHASDAELLCRAGAVAGWLRRSHGAKPDSDHDLPGARRWPALTPIGRFASTSLSTMGWLAIVKISRGRSTIA